MELGVYTFAELTDASVGPEQRLRDLLEEIELADEVGLDVFGVGEHHRPDFAVSTPAVVLAAAAARTKRIRLTSAVTVLSSDDPVRVFQDFATLDLLLELRESERVTWSGRHRPPIDDRGVYPRPVQEPLPVWVAVGGSPESAARAGRLGLPMALAIIGGLPERFVPFAELHREAAAEAGQPRPPLSINSHGYIADDARRAADEAFEPFTGMMNRIGRERGWPPMHRPDFDAMLTRRGALFVGGPEQVVEKLLFQHELFGHDRFLLQMSVGTMPHAGVLRSIELLGTEVAPAVRAELARRAS